MLYLFDEFADATALDAVKAMVGDDETIYCAGAFPDSAKRLPAEARFAFVHVDPTSGAQAAAALEFFHPRLNPRGLLVIGCYADDSRPLIAQAVDGFLEGKPESLLLLPDKSGSAVLAKG